MKTCSNCKYLDWIDEDECKYKCGYKYLPHCLLYDEELPSIDMYNCEDWESKKNTNKNEEQENDLTQPLLKNLYCEQCKRHIENNEAFFYIKGHIICWDCRVEYHRKYKPVFDFEALSKSGLKFNDAEKELIEKMKKR